MITKANEKGVSISVFLSQALSAKSTVFAQEKYGFLVKELSDVELEELIGKVHQSHKAWLASQKAIRAQASVSMFAEQSSKDTLDNVWSMIGNSYGPDQNKILNEALDMLRAIKTEELPEGLKGKYQLCIETIKAINPVYSLENAIFIEPPSAESGPACKKVKTEP